MVRQLVSRAELEGHLDLKGKELDALMVGKGWSVDGDDVKVCLPSLSLSLSRFLSLVLSGCLCVSPFLSLSPTLSLCLALSLYIALSFSLSRCIAVPVYVMQSLSQSISLSTHQRRCTPA